MILIADCGSTKVEWALIDPADKTELKRIRTSGMNAVVLSDKDLSDIIANELVPQLDGHKIGHIYFYGAGVVSAGARDNIRRAIIANIDIPSAEIDVESDLLEAARVLCGHQPGIACILGTGANSCLYDGKEIVDNVSALGYILGDEGSGAVLGRTLVSDVFKRRLPQDLCQKFKEQYNLDMAAVVENVYRRPGANRYLASLSPFLLQNIDRPEIEALVIEQFCRFFIRNISNYQNYQDHTVNFVGSIAHYYRPQLEKAAALTGCHIGKIVAAPLDGLIDYHLARL